ncbi:MAG: hypothetical protein U1E65_14865 [Myxococcota bacterium]
MSDEGEAPEGEDIAELLRERHLIPKDHGLTVEVGRREGRPRLVARVDRPEKGPRGAEQIRIDVAHLRGGDRPAWDQAADALDGLIGMLVEEAFAYRDLPTGSDVEYEDGVFWVEIEASRPELDRRADALLGKN